MRLTFSRAVALVIALPVFVHAHVILGFLLANPMYRFGSVGHSVVGWLQGQPTIDPNVAGIDQALTMRAVDTLFSGALPWWNSFEGFGQPLAGEMQSSALFPFSIILALPNGTLLIDVLLSILAGIGMLLLLRRLGISVVAALVGAVTYQMCGTFSWLSGAWSYSIAWLPFLILGIECCRSAERRDARTGIVTIAISIALLLCSGFIETSYLEGLVGVVWSIARLITAVATDRLRFAGRLAAGASLGIALGSPIIIAFADMLAMGYSGDHSAGYAGRALVPWAIIQKIVPYIYGPIFASHQSATGSVWGNTGGYIGFVMPLLAIAGLMGVRNRSVRVACGVVALFGVGAMIGGPIQSVLLLVPGVRYTAFYRYIDPSISFALCALAACYIDDFMTSADGARRHLLFGLLAMVALTAIAYAAAIPEISSAIANATDRDLAGWHWFSAGVLLVAALATLVSIRFANPRIGAMIVGCVACLEALVFLVIPTLSYPSAATVSLGGIRYLQQTIGAQRFYTLGPIGPNYGSFFGIADLDYSDLPVPARTATYVQEKLDAGTDPAQLYAGYPRPGVSQAVALAANLDAFARVGVKYVLLPPKVPPPSARLRPRYHDALMAIYEMPNTKPYFSAEGCRIDSSSRTSATTTCRAPSSLCRLELNAPGWRADVDGKPSALADCGEIFQSVPVPIGTSTVRFHFTPPHMQIGFVLFVVSIGIIATLLGSILRSRSALNAAPQRSE